MKIIDTLPPETQEALLTLCEAHSYTEASRRAALPTAEGGLNLKISASTLCRFYTTHGIVETKEARVQYAASLGLAEGKTLLDAAHENLEQRLFELSARPNPGTAELRLLGQLITKLQSLKLSQRRVEVAEKRETRMATPPTQPEKPRLLSAAEIKHRVRVLLGKEQPWEFNTDEQRPQKRWDSSTHEESASPEKPVDSAPSTPEASDASDLSS